MAAVLLDRRLHQDTEKQRDERERQQQAGNQRKAYRKRQRREQILRHSLQQEDRHKDDTNAHRRQHRRDADLPGAIDDRGTSGSFWPTCRSMFSITTVPLSTRMPTASAKPPSVIVLSVSPPTYMASIAVMIAMGIVARMISVRRQLPRKSRIISAVSPAAIRPPITTLFSAALTKTDWSKSGLIDTPAGSAA